MKTFAAALLILVIAALLALALGHAGTRHQLARTHHVLALRHMRAIA